jgi:HK97 family phage major capsid protein
MTQEEIVAASEVAEKINKTSSQVDSLQKEVESLKEKGKNTASLEEALKTAQESLKALEDFKAKAEGDLGDLAAKVEKQGKKFEGESTATAIEKALTEGAESLKNMVKDPNSKSMLFAAKAAGTMTIGNNYTGGTIGITDWMGGFTPVARRSPYIRQIINVMQTTGQYVAWAEQTARDGSAASTAEGAAKTQSDFDIVEVTKKVEKITSYMKASKESLADIAFLSSEINTELRSLLELKLDSLLYNGNGTTPNIKGIVTYATAFSVASTSLANGVDQANNFDAIRAAVWQVVNGNFMPNYVLVNPIDAALMDMTKLTDGQYVIPPFATATGQTIAGLQVIENTGVTAGDFLVGDFSKSNLVMREEINFSIGYENDDFTKNLVTILAELRGTHYVKTNHAGAFVKGTFSTVKAALETA